MKTRNSIKVTALAVAMSFMMAISASSADEQGMVENFKIKPTSVYQAIHGQVLADALAAIALRSGITFKVNTTLGEETINQSLAADNWEQAIKSLLINYNYTVVTEAGAIKTVIITGHNNNGSTISHNKNVLATDKVIIVEPKYQQLPEKYKALPAGTVTAVDLPIDSMMNVSDHAKVNLELPMGQFNVEHDYTVNELDGSKTWVGYLADEGQGYRVFLSKGDAGVMGVITTPDGSYNIESGNKGIYLVDTNKLQHAGFEGDTIVPPAAMLNNKITMNANTAQIAQLQSAASAAQAALNKANVLVAKYTALFNSEKTLLTKAQTNLAAAKTKQANSQTNYSAAYANYATTPTKAYAVALNTAKANLNAANAVYNVANINFQVINKNYAAINNYLTTATTAATTALANYNQAQAALDSANSNTNSTANNATSAIANSNVTVVDLMVVYTTDKQTQAYAKQRISLLVTASNQAYIDSKINMQLRLVHTEPTTYSENNSNAQALQDLANFNKDFANINQTRTQYGADLVFLFRPLHANYAGSCGTTYVEFAAGSDPNASMGFGTISDGNAVDKAGYFCAANTFTHEIGHSLGLVHDRENTSYPGVFNYAYAWGVSGKFGTIMSYKTPVLMYFSNPDLTTQCAGQACGYDQSDVNRSSDQTSAVNYTAPIVAGFMPSTTAVPVLN